MKFRIISTLAIALVSFASGASAQDYPTAPVNVVVPLPAGGSGDTLARLVLEEMSQIAGQQFYVENKPGAGGFVGSAEVSAGTPDGYTLLLGASGGMLSGPAINANIQYDPVADFTHIGMVGGEALMLVTTKELGVTTFEELLAKAEGSAEAIPYAVAGAGVAAHVVMEYFRNTQDLNFRPIAYAGGGPAITAMLGNEVQLTLLPLSAANLENFTTGKFVALAVTSEERLAVMPDVPTFVELGYPDMVASAWFWLAGPPAMDQAVVTRLNTLLREAIATPEVRQQFDFLSIQSPDFDAAAFSGFIEEEVARWEEFGAASGVTIE